MTKISTFDKRLIEALKKENLNQYRLAKITGIPQTTICAYMSGRFDPKRDYLKAMAKALNVQDTWLLGYDVPIQNNRRCEEEILLKLKLMNEFQLKKFNEMLTILLSLKLY